MVADGEIESTVLKAKYGSDIRKSQLHRTSNDFTYNDLLLMMQRIFKIKSTTSVILKYRDADGDLITLTDDTDLLLAIRTEPSLYVEVFTDADDLAGQLSQLDGLLSNINESAKVLKRTLQTAISITNSGNDEKVVSLGPGVVSPEVKHNESVATIQPSVHEQVDNGHVSHFQPPQHNLKHEFEEELTLKHHHQQLPTSQPPQNVAFLGQMENVPIDNNGHAHGQGYPSTDAHPKTEEIALNDSVHNQPGHDFNQFQQTHQQHVQMTNSFSPNPLAHEAYRTIPQQFPPTSQISQQQFQQPGFLQTGPPPNSGTPTPQFPLQQQQQPLQAQQQLYKPPGTQQYGTPPSPGQKQQPPMMQSQTYSPPGAPGIPAIRPLGGPQFQPMGGAAPPMGHGLPPVSAPQYGGMQPPPRGQLGAPGFGPPPGPTPPSTAYEIPPAGPGGLNPFARSTAPQAGAYVRPAFNNY